MENHYQSLNGRWKINRLPFDEDMEEILGENFVPEGWLTTNVPEQVQSVLRREGIIKGHTYHKQPEEDRWIEECDWVYYKEFTGPEYLPEEGDILLECCGLDTFCDIYLNGVLVGSGNNMFRQFSFSVRGILKVNARNVIVIRFYSAANYVRNVVQTGIFSITTSDRILARKAQMNYGWDFCGRTVTVGIWKSIGIRINSQPFLEDWYLETKEIGENQARLSFSANIGISRQCKAGEKLYVRVELFPPDREADLCCEEPWHTGGEADLCCEEPLHTGGGTDLCCGEPLHTGGEVDLCCEELLHTDRRVVLYCEEVRQEGNRGEVRMEIAVEDPLLWWPIPYGEQNLYLLRIALFSKDGENEETLYETKEQKVGIRTIEVLKEQQEEGRSFQFCVNGRKLFIRGANWVPMQMVYTDIREEDYKVYLDYAAEGRISMLRIWGGGIYESSRMFELCDEKGILIWNDFMLSCGIYPQNGEFLENVRLEAQQVVKKYRNYACLAIWSGDNENGQAYGWAGRDYEFTEDRIGNEVLKEVCQELDLGRCYIPTSPCSPDQNYKGGDNPSSPFQGDQHIYIMSADPGVNAYRDYGRQYYKRILGYRPRFMSEFGFISLPEKETFYRYNFLREPIRNREEMEKHLPMIGKYLAKNDYEHAIYYSQLFNAMALKFWIEYFRSLKGICSGTLYWKFNDPVADRSETYIFPSHMSAVDMYQHPRMTYYYTRRAYADVLVAIVEENLGDNLRIFVINETLETLPGKLILSLRDFQGNVLWRREETCLAGADAATLICTVSRKQLEQGRGEERYLKAEWVMEKLTCENRYYFVDLNENDMLKLPPAGLRCVECRYDREKEEVWVRFRTDYLARNVRINICDVQAHYSDNYFDLDAGEEKVIHVKPCFQGELDDIRSRVLYVEAGNQKRFVAPLGEESQLTAAE